MTKQKQTNKQTKALKLLLGSREEGALYSKSLGSGLHPACSEVLLSVRGLACPACIKLLVHSRRNIISMSHVRSCKSGESFEALIKDQDVREGAACGKCQKRSLGTQINDLLLPD